ncbi:hypothetical protein B0H21DRAFT_697127 [Amylocystis lapponica]|nr:hypothetical protein B0H21DRAFT_697127 [Amylocystis lapponica]
MVLHVDSLVVCSTEIRDLSRMSIVLRGQDGVVEQLRRQLEDLVPVWAVLDYTNTLCIERELVLAKVTRLGPEYLEDQLLGGTTHERRRADTPKVVQQFERTGHPEAEPHLAQAPLTPTQALRLRSETLQAVSVLTQQFNGHIVHVCENTVIVEMCGKTSRFDAFLRLLEAARTGLMVMPRTPIHGARKGEDSEDDGGAVDASLL